MAITWTNDASDCGRFTVTHGKPGYPNALILHDRGERVRVYFYDSDVRVAAQSIVDDEAKRGARREARLAAHEFRFEIGKGTRDTTVMRMRRKDSGDEWTYGATYFDDCAFCDRRKAARDTFFPDHEPKAQCDSGRSYHCTCDACF